MEPIHETPRLSEIKRALQVCAMELKELRTGEPNAQGAVLRVEKQLENAIAGFDKYFGLFEHAVQGMFIGNLDGKLIDCNSACARVLGYESPEELVNMEDFASRHFYDLGDWKTMLDALCDKKAVINMETRMIRRDGEVIWVLCNTRLVETQVGDRLIEGLAIDVTDRKKAEEKVRESEEKHRRIVETAGEGFLLMNRDMEIVEVNKACLRVIGFSREELLGKTPMDLANPQFREFLEIRREELMAMEYRTVEGTVVAKSGREIPVLIHGNILRDSKERIIGHVAFVADMTEHKKALALAAEVQKGLMPQRMPEVPGLDVAGKSVPCEEVGGDYFDFLWGSQYPFAPFSLAVGDVSGHGLDAALLMASARAFLRMRAARPGSASSIISGMNRHLTSDIFETGRFMTLFYMALDPRKKKLAWVRAGHEPAFLYHPHEDVFEELRGCGVALGIDRDMDFSEYERDNLRPGCIIAVGTDGVWECRNNEGEMFGKKRFRKILRQNANKTAQEILDAVFDQVGQFTAGTRREDDVTLVVVKPTQAGWQ